MPKWQIFGKSGPTVPAKHYKLDKCVFPDQTSGIFRQSWRKRWQTSSGPEAETGRIWLTFTSEFRSRCWSKRHRPTSSFTTASSHRQSRSIGRWVCRRSGATSSWSIAWWTARRSIKKGLNIVKQSGAGSAVSEFALSSRFGFECRSIEDNSV